MFEVDGGDRRQADADVSSFINFGLPSVKSHNRRVLTAYLYYSFSDISSILIVKEVF